MGCSSELVHGGRCRNHSIVRIIVVGKGMGVSHGGLVDVLRDYLILVLIVLITLVVIRVNGLGNATHIVGCTKLIHKSARQTMGLRVANAQGSRLVTCLSSVLDSLASKSKRCRLMGLGSTTCRRELSVRDTC